MMRRFALCLAVLSVMAAGANALTDGPDLNSRPPAFQLQDLNGKTVSSADYAGKVVLVEFFATWCPHSQESLPTMQALSQSPAAKRGDLVVLPVTQKQQKDAVQPYITQHEYTFPVLLDPDGRIGDSWNRNHIPMFVLLGADGRVKFIGTGFSEDLGHKLEAAVDRAVAEKGRTNGADTSRGTDQGNGNQGNTDQGDQGQNNGGGNNTNQGQGNANGNQNNGGANG